MSDELEITIPGLRLAARAWGRADAPPMLCLHGWLDNAASFDRLLPALGGRRFVALDLPGHGLSDHRGPGAHYGFLDTVAEVAMAVHALGWPRFGLLGHSLGAAVASTLAGTWPDRVDALVCLEGLGPMSEHPRHAADRLAKALADQIDKGAKRPVVHASVDDAVARLGASFAKLSPVAARVLCTRGLVEVEGGFTWRTDPRLRWASRARLVEEQVLAFLGRITCPALLVRASVGLPVETPEMRARLAAVAHWRQVMVEGSHHVHLEAPELVAAPIAAFLAELE
ncbi:MAG TPA: alpha/beta hydrolase [Nannocystaceae bacterium]|nr:alpha/beta hydrolase [Nannocystaceae bacterium]